MPAKPVQVSIDGDLLRRIDANPETKRKGRSAFIRAAVEAYLAVKRRQEIDAAFSDAYQGEADAMFDEIAELVDRQSWPGA